MNHQRIIISANFTIDPVMQSAVAFLGKLGIDHEVVVAPYNQVFQQLLDTSSLFHSNTEGVNVVFLRIQDLVDAKAFDFSYGSIELEKIRSNAAELGACLQTAKGFRVPLFVFLCPASDNILSDSALTSAFREIEASFIDAAGRIPNIFVFRTEHLFSRFSITTHDNPKGNSIGHIPYTEEFFSALGTELARQTDALLRKPYKVLALDCDNTLWDGVCGEDGTDGIGFCKSRLILQRFAVDQSKKGVLICLCSKNNETDVWEVFDHRSEMILKREHLVSSRINWNPKSANLKSLAEELQLGLDSFVFIDDDSAVCAEVRENCPEVLTFQIPPSVADLPKFLEHIWVFDRLKITAEDQDRTRSYQRQVERNKLQAETPDLSTFLESLQLVCEISEITAEQVPRVAQLSLRTNQFNSTTIRRSEAEIQGLIRDARTFVRTVSVKDRFGDYGLVGVAIFEVNTESIDLSSFMLSCRVLGRGVEHAVVRDIAKMAAGLGKSSINIAYRPSAKNMPFLHFATEFGDEFKVVNGENTVYRIPVRVAENIQLRENASLPLSAALGINEKPSIAQEGDRMPRHEVYIEIANTLSQLELRRPESNASDIVRTKLSSKFVEARNKTESELKNVWEKLLSFKNIGVSDDFFELGGDSLVAVSLFVEIENKFDVELPLSALINSPTIETLAALIEHDSSSKDSKYLVPIQEEGTRPPLFCMHAAGGNVLFYRDLASALGSDQPVYGLQARGVANKAETAHERIEDMAREYLREIRLVQPEGPYRLCGSSFGGLVAFEAAQQLRENREEVEILALFDTYAPGYLDAASRPVPVKRMNRVWESLSSTKNQLSQIGTIREQIYFVFEKMNKLKTRLKRKVLWKKNEFAIQYNKVTGKELPLDVQRNHKAIDKALASYCPRVYEGQVILFRASDQPKNIAFDPYLGWGNYTIRDVVSIEVMGTHGALTVYPFAGHLAKELNPFLTEKPVRETEVSRAAA